MPLQLHSDKWGTLPYECIWNAASYTELIEVLSKVVKEANQILQGISLDAGRPATKTPSVKDNKKHFFIMNKDVFFFIIKTKSVSIKSSKQEKMIHFLSIGGKIK